MINIGDKARILDNGLYPKHFKGKVGTVTAIRNIVWPGNRLGFLYDIRLGDSQFTVCLDSRHVEKA